MIAHTQAVAALYPVRTIFGEIEARLHKLDVGASFEALHRHVCRQQISDVQGAGHLTYYHAYLEQQYQGRCPSARYRRDFVREGLRALELAILACEKVRSAQPKPLRALLDEARDFCRQFDVSVTVYEQRLQACDAARRRGGTARQANLEPARRRAARLLLIKAPPGGWKDPPHAARAIEADLAAFVAARRLSMWGARRTIVRWILHHPTVRSAYGKSRRADAS